MRDAATGGLVGAGTGRSTVPAVGLALALGTLALYAPAAGFDFVRYDDPSYVTRNSWVLEGLSRESVTWSLTAFQVGNWHPLTLLSHMLDVELFGTSASGHHLVSVALHAANAVLLFLLLEQLTGLVSRSALVAALFAVHPLNVEAVAWVSQRKTVLCAFFLLLTMIAYGGWARRGGGRRYGLAFGAFLLALASKPMAVTLPLLLLLLDLWPLGRWRGDQAGRARATLRLLGEKIPFAVAAAVVGLVTLVAQRSAEALGTLAGYPPSDRVAKATVALAWYPVKMVAPTGLSLFYPLSLGPAAAWKIAGASILLLLVSAVAFGLVRSRRHLAVGWVWYLVGILPVAGAIQYGTQIVADRYAYLPLIGLFVAFVWTMSDATARGGLLARYAAAAVTAATLAGLAATTVATLRPWRDTISLLSRGVETAPENPHALVNLGLELVDRERFDEAIPYLSRAEAIVPRFPPLHIGLGRAYEGRGDLEQALAHYEEALRLRPADPRREIDVGRLLGRLGRAQEAAAHLERALLLDPGHEAASGAGEKVRTERTGGPG